MKAASACAATPTRTLHGEEDATTGELKYGEIVVIDKNGEEGDHLPFYGKALIGRTEDCDIRINLPYISRKHAFICLDENGNVSMRNLAKRNMTMVNSVVVDDEITLASGDVITIADRRFEWVGSDYFLRSSKDVVSVKPKQRGKTKTPAKKKSATPKPATDGTGNRSALKETSNSVLNRAASEDDEEKARKALEASRAVDDIFNVLNSTPGRAKKAQSAKKSAAKSRALPTPLRKAIQTKNAQAESDAAAKAPPSAQKSKSASSTTIENPKKLALPTPVRKSIQQRKKVTPAKDRQADANQEDSTNDSSSRAGEENEVRASADLDSAKREAPGASVFAQKKSALATPVREQIRERGAKKAQVDIFAKKKSALATPVREEIRQRGAKKPEAEIFAKKKSALATPVREEIRQRGAKKPQAEVFAKKKSALATPVREEIRAQKPRAKKHETKKVLATPLRKQIENEKRFAGLPASAARFLKKTPGDAVADAIKAAAEDEENATGAEDTCTEAELSEHDLQEGEDEKEELLESSEVAKDDLEREEINAKLQARGYEVSRYQDWSIDELTQRLRSATLQDDLVSAYTDNEEYEEDYDEEYDEEYDEAEEGDCVTPQKKTVFEGKHKVFETPGETPKSTVSSGVVHWTYSDYERDDEDVSDGASTASLEVAVEYEVAADAQEEEEEEEHAEDEVSEHEEDEQEAGEVEASSDDLMAELSNQLEAAVRIEADEEEEVADVEEVADDAKAEPLDAKGEEVDTPAFKEAQSEEDAGMQDAQENEEVDDDEEAPASPSPAPARRKSLRIAAASAVKTPAAVDEDDEEEEEILEVAESDAEESMDVAPDTVEVESDAHEADDDVEQEVEKVDDLEQDVKEETSAVNETQVVETAAETSAEDMDGASSEIEEIEESSPAPARRKSMRLVQTSEDAGVEEDDEEDADESASEASSNLDATLVAQCESLKVAELRELLKNAGLETKGKKVELVERLASHVASLSPEDRAQFFPESRDSEEENAQPRRTILIPFMLKVAELKAELAARGVEAKGRKAELAEALQTAIIAEEREHVEKSDDGEVFVKEGHEMLWEPVARELDGELCPAVVVGFLPPTKEDPYEMFRVRFLDGDVEDLEPEELAAARDAFASL